MRASGHIGTRTDNTNTVREAHALISIAASHEAVRADFLRLASDGEISTSAMAHFVRGYESYSRMFPSIIDAGRAHWLEHPQMRALLDEVFVDERGGDGDSHADGLLRCADSFDVDLNPRTLDQVRASCVRYARTVLALCKSDGFMALGAIGPATECIVPAIYDQLLSWFRAESRLRYDSSFFAEHIEVDGRHSECIMTAIELAVTDHPSGLAMLRDGMLITLNARRDLWNDISDALGVRHSDKARDRWAAARNSCRE